MMSRIRRWHDVRGALSIIAQSASDGVWDILRYRELPMLVRELLIGEVVVVNIGFVSTGFDDPGIRSGPPEECRPPECMDERAVDFVSINDRALPMDIAQQIFDLYRDEVQAVELDLFRGR